MSLFNLQRQKFQKTLLPVLSVGVLILLSIPTYAQKTDATHGTQTADQEQLTVQLRQLQQKVAQLEAALKEQSRSTGTSQTVAGSTSGQGMMDDDMDQMNAMNSGQGKWGGGMGMMDDQMGGMGPKKSPGMGNMEQSQVIRSMRNAVDSAPGNPDSMMQMMKLMERMQMMQMMQMMQRESQVGGIDKNQNRTQSQSRDVQSKDSMVNMMQMMERMQMMQMMQMMQKDLQGGMPSGTPPASMMQDM